MKNLLLIPFIVMIFFTYSYIHCEEAVIKDSVTIICYNLEEIIISHTEGYFESLEGEILYMQDDSLKMEWDPNIYLIEGTNCSLSEVWGAKAYTCTIEDGMFSQSLEEIYDMMRTEVRDCLSQYCEFGESEEEEEKDGEIIYERMWAKINDYFGAGVTIRLFKDEEGIKKFELVVY